MDTSLIFEDFDPLGSALIGATHTENVRHACVRAPFMNALLEDPRVTLQFATWGKRTGLYQAANRVAQAGDALASVLGLSRRELLIHENQRRLLECAKNRQVIRLADGFCSESDTFLRQVSKDGGHRLQASAFVRETLGLPWGWLVYELIDAFFRHLHARAFDLVITRHFQVVFQPPAPQLHIEFRTLEGETLSHAARRLTQGFAEAWYHLATEAEARIQGRRPKGTAAHLGRYARWFYHCRVQRPPHSIRQVAREYATSRMRHGPSGRVRETDCRPIVQRGIKEAERLLALGQYDLKPVAPLPD